MASDSSVSLLSYRASRTDPARSRRIRDLALRLDRALAGQGYIFGAIALIMAIRMIAVAISGIGYDRLSLDPLFWNALALWAAGFGLRVWRPDLPIVYMLEGTALMLLAGLQTTIAASAVASLGMPYADPWLAHVDSVIAPWLDWPSMVRALAAHSQLYALLNQAYISAGWQPLLLLFLILIFGKTEQAFTFVTAGALSLVICVGVFAWMPASGAFVHHGISFADVSQIQVSLGFDFLPILEGLRDGSLATISRDNLSGLVSFPSMHAASAAIFALAWARFGKWSIPMVLLNVMMAFSAMPVGNHYFVDIVAGGLLGVASFWLAHRLITASLARQGEGDISPARSGQPGRTGDDWSGEYGRKPINLAGNPVTRAA